MNFSYLVKRERRSDGAGSSGGEAGREETSYKEAISSSYFLQQELKEDNKTKDEEIDELSRQIQQEITAARSCMCRLEQVAQLDQKLTEITRLIDDVNSFCELSKKIKNIRKKMALIKEEDDCLNTELLQLQDEAINLQQKGTQMQLEYEEVQSQVIRELCRRQELHLSLEQAAQKQTQKIQTRKQLVNTAGNNQENSSSGDSCIRAAAAQSIHVPAAGAAAGSAAIPAASAVNTGGISSAAAAAPSAAAAAANSAAAPQQQQRRELVPDNPPMQRLHFGMLLTGGQKNTRKRFMTFAGSGLTAEKRIKSRAALLPQQQQKDQQQQQQQI